MNDHAVHLSWVYALANWMGLSQTQVVTTPSHPFQSITTAQANSGLRRQPQIHTLRQHLLITNAYLLSTLHLSLGQFLIYLLGFGNSQTLISLFSRTGKGSGLIVHADGVF